MIYVNHQVYQAADEQTIETHWKLRLSTMKKMLST